MYTSRDLEKKCMFRHFDTENLHNYLLLSHKVVLYSQLNSCMCMFQQYIDYKLHHLSMVRTHTNLLIGRN